MGRLVLFGFHALLISAPLFAFSLSELLFQSQANRTVFFVASALLGFALFSLVVDLGLLQALGKKNIIIFSPVKSPRVAVGMTAYNDEGVIGKAVKDFLETENVAKVVVIDNNSVDATAKEAQQAGAIAFQEKVQGYGAASKRALVEARKYGNVVCLVEGDQTFSASDLKKLLAYIENCDLVVGTRTTSELTARDSQLTWFIRYGNLFIAKLLQLRFWGTRFTDVGCTFRIIRPDALDKIVNKLHVTGNHFGPHMLIETMKADLKIIEVPVTLRKRAGVSKGVGSSYWRGLKNGINMWKMILFS